MSTIQEIKVRQAAGESVSAIAKALNIDRKTVRKYQAQTDFSPPVSAPRPRASILAPYQATIDTWLAEDQREWYKQRHTAFRVYDRLRKEFPACTVSYRTVRRYVQARRRPTPTTGTLR